MVKVVGGRQAADLRVHGAGAAARAAQPAGGEGEAAGDGGRGREVDAHRDAEAGVGALLQEDSTWGGKQREGVGSQRGPGGKQRRRARSCKRVVGYSPR